MESVFYYPLTLHQGLASGSVVAPWTNDLPSGSLSPDPSVVVLTQNESLPDGMYLWNGTQWRLVIPYQAIAQAIINGSVIELFYAMTSQYTGLPSNAQLWKNSVQAPGTTITAGTSSVWGAAYQPAQNVGDVRSVNGQIPDGQGNVVVQASPNPAGTGQSLVLNNGATTGNIILRQIVGGTGVNAVVDGNGNIDINNAGVLSVSGQTGAVTVSTTDNNPATGTSLIVVSGALTGATKLKTIVAGTGITLAADGNGNLQINGASTYTLPVATATVLGGVKQGTGVTIAGDGTLSAATYTLPVATASTLGGVKQGANVAIAGDGTLSVAAPYVLPVASAIVLGGVKQGTGVTIAGDGTISTSVSALTAVNSEGTGTSLVDNNGTTGGIATIKSVAAGSNVTITAAGDGKTLTIAANQVLAPATATTIGGVIVKAGLAVDGSGNLTLAAPTGVNLGGVKAGTGIAIAGDGTISATGAVASVSGQTGAVVVQATNNNAATGTSLISDSGATTANIKLKTIVAGSGITLAADGSGNLQINSTATGGVSSITAGSSGALTGAITFTAGQSISLSNTGNSIQINGTGVPEAPNDGNQYARQNLGWTVLPSLGSAITSVTGQTGTGAVLLVEASPPANSAIIKSLVAGTNVTITEASGLLTIAASIPGGTVATVNGQSPNGSGAVTLTAANLNAVPVAGNVTMTGPLNMGSQVFTGLVTPVNPSDAVPLSYVTGLVINGGVIG